MSNSKGILDLLVSAAKWAHEHEGEINAFVTWGVVSRAGRESGLYVPMDGPTWNKIESAASNREDPDLEQIILSSFSPGGIGYDSLVSELRSADPLQRRDSDLEEVLASIEDSRFFVTICGALPLVEFVLSSAAGSWNDPRKHLEEINRRLSETLASEIEAELIIESSALEMVRSEIPEIWRDGRQNIGAIEEKLNRHRVLHGATSGWAVAANATRSLLLLAAAAKVSKSLLGPSPVESDSESNS